MDVDGEGPIPVAPLEPQAPLPGDCPQPQVASASPPEPQPPPAAHSERPVPMQSGLEHEPRLPGRASRLQLCQWMVLMLPWMLFMSMVYIFVSRPTPPSW